MDRPVSVVSTSLTTALNTPLPPLGDNDPFLDPPRASFLDASNSTLPRDSYVPSTPGGSGPLLPAVTNVEPDEAAEPEPTRDVVSSKAKRRPLVLWLAALAALTVVVLAVVLPVYFTVVKPRRSQSAGGGVRPPASDSNPPGEDPAGGSESPETPQRATTGGDGSTIITEDGSSFTYTNKFGGYWVSDPDDPFNNGARPNSWTPPLNQSWAWGSDRVYGVNLGGLFVLEPFISPALFQKYPGATDEWSLSTLMAADTGSGGLKQLEDHYNTFITEQDIAEIAGAGLNWIRLPIPFWAIETWPGEPFLAKTSWKYILRVFEWARKYGLRVNLDLHTIPGSQNGYNHSGKGGRVNFLNGVMGFANAQRTLDYIRIITQFISQPQYRDVVQMFGIMNEPLLSTIGRSQLSSFYLEVHNIIREITGTGTGNGPYISFGDGFGGLASWAGFLTGSDRVVLDMHPYFAFDGSTAASPIATGTGAGAGGVWPQRACERWASSVNTSRSAFGITVAGEFSNGFNDCGLFLTGVGGSQSYGGDCATDWQDASLWDAATKAGLQEFAMASMDALQDFFFWTWKIGNSTAGHVEAPLWSYQLGLQNGWMPTDPRETVGKCASLGVSGPIFDGAYQPWQTGGAGAGSISASDSAAFPWPPVSIANAGAPASLPSYTPTGTVATLPPPTFTASITPTPTLNGWFNAQDTSPAPTEIAGCTYPDAWNAITVAIPPLCTGAAPLL